MRSSIAATHRDCGPHAELVWEVAVDDPVQISVELSPPRPIAQIAKPGGPARLLDDPPPVLIDEWQRCPRSGTWCAVVSIRVRPGGGFS